MTAAAFAEKSLSRVAKIVHTKQLMLRNNGPYFLVESMYEFEPRFHRFTIDEYYGFVRSKAKHAFRGNSLVRVYLVRCSSAHKLTQFKIDLRTKLRGNVIHIPDTHAEAVHLVPLVFGESAERLLNEMPL